MSTIELSAILGLKGVSEAILENEKYTIKSSIPLLFINTQEGNASDHDRGSIIPCLRITIPLQITYASLICLS